MEFTKSIWNIFLGTTITYSVVGFLIWLFMDSIKEFFFLHRVRFPKTYLKTPEKLFSGACNFYIKSQSNNTLGVWHIPPIKTSQLTLQNAQKVVLYVHGNALTRGSKNRLIYYELMRNNGFHVVTFDYSGFADSTGNPDHQNVILDTISVYRWMINQIENENALVLVHGHSLGTAIGTLAMSKLLKSNEESIYPKAVILEAPFTCTSDAITHYPISKYTLALYPYFKTQILKTIKKLKIEMETIRHLSDIKSHILILHAEDDNKVCYDHGYELFKTTSMNPDKQALSLKFYGFNKSYKLLHFPTQHPNFTSILNDYLVNIQDNDNSVKETYF